MTGPAPEYLHRAVGAVVGSAVGDALGAPFEFQSAGTYRRRFPSPVVGGIGEMVGGGGLGWAAGEFTDDTQMAMLVARSLLETGGVDQADLGERFRAWVASDPTDVGVMTRSVLSAGGDPVVAAADYFRAHPHRSAGNGSLMRTAPAAVFFAPEGAEATMAAARAISAVTHADPVAQNGCAISHELVRRALDGEDPFTGLKEVVAAQGDQAGRYAEVLAPGWGPSSATRNGTVWDALATAVWAVRHHSSFEDAVVAAIDAGDDADTVGAITGGLAGAIWGAGAIPSRWTTYLHGTALDETYRLADLQDLARRLAGAAPVPLAADEPGLGAAQVRPGLWVGNLTDAAGHDGDVAMVSLCRPKGHHLRRPVRREVYLVDRDGSHNPALDVVLGDVLDSIAAFRNEGRDVFVHCHSGRSRTGLVLRAWLMAHEGLDYEQALTEAKAQWPHLTTVNGRFEQRLRDGPS